eukprot:g4287.t1
MFPVDHPDPFQLFECHGESSNVEDGFISALRWLDDDRLIVGFRSGAIHVYDANTLRLLFCRTFHPKKSPVRRIKRLARTIVARPVPGGLAATPFLEVWYLHQDGVVIAHSFETLEKAIMGGRGGGRGLSSSRRKDRRRRHDASNDGLDGGGGGGKSDATSFEHFAWTFSGQKTVDDFCVVVPTRSSLFDAHPPGNIAHILAFGSEPPIASYLCRQRSRTRSKAGVVKEFASAVVGKLSSTMLNWGLVTKTNLADLVGGGSSSGIGGDELEGGGERRKKKIRPARLTIHRSLRDSSRRVESVSMDPSGTVCVTTDNLGRVLLLDAETLRVLRMWKGYRDAQCGWMHYHQRSDYEASSPALSRPPSWDSTATDGLYVVLYTANRRVLEIWRARCGPRVDAVTVPGGCRLFTLPFPVIENMDDRNVARSYRARCMLLRPSACASGVVWEGEEKEETEGSTKPGGQGNWDLLEVVLSEDAKAVVRKHFRRNVDQRESRALSRLMSVVGCLDLEEERDETEADRGLRRESALRLASAIRTPSLQSRAADALEGAKRFQQLQDLYRNVLEIFLRSATHGDAKEGHEDASQLKRSFRWRLELLRAWLQIEREKTRTATATAPCGDKMDATEAGFVDEILLWVESARTQYRARARSETDAVSFLRFRRETEKLRNAPSTEKKATGVEGKSTTTTTTTTSKGKHRPQYATKCSLAVETHLFGALFTSSPDTAATAPSRAFACLEAVGLSREILCRLFSNFLCHSSFSNIERRGLHSAQRWLRDVAGTKGEAAICLSRAMREACLDVETPRFHGVLLLSALCISTLLLLEDVGDVATDEIDEWCRIRRAARTALFVSACVKDNVAPSSPPEGNFEIFLSTDPSKLRAIVAAEQLKRQRRNNTATTSTGRKRRGRRNTRARSRSSSIGESVGGKDTDRGTEREKGATVAKNETASVLENETASARSRSDESEMVSQCSHLVALAIDSSHDSWDRLVRAHSYATHVAPLLCEITEETVAVHRIQILSSEWRELNSRVSNSAKRSFAKLDLLRWAVRELDQLHACSALSGPSSYAMWNDVLKPVVESMLEEDTKEEEGSARYTRRSGRKKTNARRDFLVVASPAGKIIQDSHRVQFLALCQRTLGILTESVATTSSGRGAVTQPSTGSLCVSQYEAYVEAKHRDYDVVCDFVAMRLARIFYETGDDAQGETQIDHLRGDASKFALAKALLPIAQQRLATIFRMCESSALHAPVLACIDADVCRRLLQEATIDGDGGGTTTFTLAMTEALLKRVEILFAESCAKEDTEASKRADALGWIAQLRKAACEALSAARERRLIIDSGGGGSQKAVPSTPKARGGVGRKRGGSGGSGGDWV